jgi:glycosyltransferase involved in cell wall biosynthesis
VIYNSLDVEKQNHIYLSMSREVLIAKKRNYFGGNFVLGFIGRLVPGKKIDMILCAMEQLRQLGIECGAMIIGDGIERKYLEETARAKHLSVKFLGPLYNENDIGENIMLMDVVVSPGNVGLTAMHSLIYGTPVITHSDFCSQGPEFESIIDGQSGMFFKRDCPDDLSRAIMEWFKKYPTKTETLESVCRNIILNKYNAKIQAETILNYIRKRTEKP